MKKYFPWVNIARGIGMILVVMGHAAHDTWIRSGNESFAVQFLIDFIYSFHMPLFFFVSGFCCQRILKLVKLREKSDYIFTRFKRLMVPYFCVGILYIPVKLLFADEATNRISWDTFIDFFNGSNPHGQLWTLYALFLLAVFFTLINPVEKKAMLVISLVLTIFSAFYDIKISIIQRSTYEALFYMWGLFMGEWWEKSGEKLLTKKRCILLAAASFVVLLGLNIARTFSGFLQLYVPAAIVGIACVCFISIAIQEHKCRILNTVGKYSMDIYIIANAFQVLSRSILLNRLHLPHIVCFAASLIAGLVIPVIISKFIIRKVPLFKMLILGDFPTRKKTRI